MKKKLLSILLTLAMLLTLLPGMSLTAYAAPPTGGGGGDGPGISIGDEVNVNPYAGLVNTTTVVSFDGKDWYLIEDNSTAADARTVTLLAKECVGASAYNSSGSFVEYSSNPTIKTVVDAYYNNNVSTDAKTAVSGDGMFLLTTAQADKIYHAIYNDTFNTSVSRDVLKCSQYDGTDGDQWWLCSPSSNSQYAGILAPCVDCSEGMINDGGDEVTKNYGVRPALTLDLSKVTFDSASNTFAVPAAAVVEYPVWVRGTQVTSANANDVLGTADGEGATVTYTPADGSTPAKLTLNDATITSTIGSHENAAIYADENLTIETTADSSVTGPDCTSGDSYGIREDNYHVITFTGTGTLTVTGGKATGENSISYGVYADSGAVTVNGKLTATGGTATSYSNGVCALYGNVTVNSTGELTGTGGEATLTSYGVFAQYAVTVSGKMDATGGTADTSYGIYANLSDVTVNGELTATGGTATYSYGVYVFGAVTVKAGSKLTATGNNQAIKGSVINDIEGAGWSNTAGTEGAEAIEPSTDGRTLSYMKVQFPFTLYDVWVRGVQVTSANASNVLGDGKVSYTPAQGTTPAKLTLNDATISGNSGSYENTAIYAREALTIDVTGDNRVTGPDASYSFGVFGSGALTVTGTGTLTATGGKATGIASSAGIDAGTITVDTGCTLIAVGGTATTEYGTSNGVFAVTVTVNGTLSATGGTATRSSYGVHVASGVVNGTLNAKGGKATGTNGISCGVYAQTGAVTVSADSALIAAGDTQAINGTVKNNIAGIGWMDTAGTADKMPIAANREGQTIPDAFKKVQFPAHDHSFTYTANSATITATCSAAGCYLPESSAGVGDHAATLTIAAPQHSVVGDGKDAAAIITDDYGIQGNAKVKYQKKTGESSYDTETETAPTDAGDYKASITLGEATASVEYSIVTLYPVWVGNTQVTSANMNNVLSDGKVGYTPADGSTPAKLTLSGATITSTIGSHENAAIYADEDLTIETTADSTVTGPDVTGNSYGICADNDHSLTFTGSGKLTAMGGEATEEYSYSCGVYAEGDVTVSVNCTLTVKGGEASGEDSDSYGVYADSGAVTVSGELTAEGGAATGEHADSCGVYAYQGAVNVSGKLTATGGTAEYSYGVETLSGAVTVSGELTAKGGTATDESCGVSAASVTVSANGTLDATGGEAKNSYGVNADSVIVSANGRLDATGGTATGENSISCGVYANSDVTVEEGGTLTATGGAATRKSYGVYANSDVTVNGKLTATGGAATGENSISCGVSADSVTVSANGRLDATGGTATYSYGVYADSAVTVNGTLTATGGTQAIYGTVKNAITGTGWTGAGGTGDAEAIETNDAGQTLDSYKKVMFQGVTFYPLWVGGVQVTSVNASNITGGATVTASYDAAAKTLSLDNYTYEGDQACGVRYTGTDKLTIRLTGTNSLTTTSMAMYQNAGVLTDGDLTLTGSGKLTAVGETQQGSGIAAGGTLTITDGVTVEATGGENGITAGADVSITGGTVTANGRKSIAATADVTISGGTLNAGGTSPGIVKGAKVTISGGTLNVSVLIMGTEIVISGGTINNPGGLVIQAVAESGGAAGPVTISGGTINRNAEKICVIMGAPVTISGGRIYGNGQYADGISGIDGAVNISGSAVIQDTNIGGKTVTVSGGTLDRVRILGTESVNISGGTVHAICPAEADPAISGGQVQITGGTVSAENTTEDGVGIRSTGDGGITIGENVASVTATGAGKAIDGTVKNAVDGVGWTDTAGTTGKASIAANPEGQTISDTFKKLRFPEASTEPVITGADLVLDGTLTMRFYVLLPENFDATGAHMVFTVHGRTIDVPFNQAGTAADGQKTFPCPVYSIEMAEPIEAVFHYTKDGKAGTATRTRSLKDYLDAAQAVYPSDEKLQALIAAIRNYGHYIQPYLARLHSFTVGEGGYAEMPAASAITPLSSLDGYKTRWNSVNPDILDSVGYYDTFDTSTILHVQVKLKSSANVTATVNGEACAVKPLGGNVYAVEIPNIAANNLDLSYRVVFSANGSPFCDINVSALTYVSAVLDSGRDQADEKAALTAFYDYYQAAEAYQA